YPGSTRVATANSVLHLRQSHGTPRLEPAPNVVERTDFQPLWLEQFEQVLGDSGGGVLLEDPHVAVAGDVVLEALELDAPVGRHVADGERGKVGQATIGADRAEFPGLGDDVLVRAG